MQMKPSLSTSASQMQDRHAGHHHHHQSNLALTRPGYENTPLVLIAPIITVANGVLQPPEGGGCLAGQQLSLNMFALKQAFFFFLTRQRW